MIRKSFSYIFIGVYLFLLLVSIGFSNSIQNRNEASFSKTYIFMLDINNIICPICMDSLSNLLNILKNIPPEDIIGIVVCNNIHFNSERSKRIIEKQIKGFKIGNNIHFPLYVDYKGSFNCLNGKKALLVELDHFSRKIIELSFDKK